MILSLDPGEVFTGWAKFQDDICLNAGYWQKQELYSIFNALLPRLELVIIEEFRLYPSKAKILTNSKIQTAEIIGAIKLLCEQHNIFWIEQPAQIKKFWENNNYKKLKEAGFYVKNKHARDAIIHGLHYLKFGKEKK